MMNFYKLQQNEAYVASLDAVNIPADTTAAPGSTL